MFISKKELLVKLKINAGKIKGEPFDFNKIERFFLLRDKNHFYQVISDRTFQDLDMNEVFMFIDRTASKIGQQVLYQVLRTIPGNNSRTEKFEKIIDILKENPEVRDELLLEISSLNKRDAYYVSSLFLENYLQKPKWFWIVPVFPWSVFSPCCCPLFFRRFLFFLFYCSRSILEYIIGIK